MAQVPCYCMLVHHHKLRAGRLWQEWPLRIVWDLIQDDPKSGGKPHGKMVLKHPKHQISGGEDFGVKLWRSRVGGYDFVKFDFMIGD